MRNHCKKHGYMDVMAETAQQCPYCQLASVQAELEEAKKWKIPLAEAMFAMTTCIQSGEELAIPDIWDMVCKERDELREEIERYRKALERIKCMWSATPSIIQIAAEVLEVGE